MRCPLIALPNMEWDDIFENFDWDPSYLALIFSEDFFDMSYLWNGNTDGVTDAEFINFVEKTEKYQPCVEDISLDDNILCQEVAWIESERVKFRILIVFEI